MIHWGLGTAKHYQAVPLRLVQHPLAGNSAGAHVAFTSTKKKEKKNKKEKAFVL